MKTCYYELLGVESTALEADLKKAYRKKALQLHPDKNPGNVEEATAQFNLVRAAYEVLSDPQERAWYDSHKNQILRDDDDDFGDDGDQGEMIIPSIAVEDIYRYFNPSMYTTFDDSSHGFYSIVNLLFERLAREEVQHGKYQNLPKFSKYKDDDSNAHVMGNEFLLLPRFGNSTTEFPLVKDFYGAWGNFQTVKTFNWMDEYRYSHAPDRRTRRLMERENKKLRDGARKEYNETIRKFVAFVKKRDPRYNDGLKQWEKHKRLQRQQDLEKQLQQQHQANLETLARKNNYEVQDWQQFSAKEIEELETMLQDEYASPDDDLEFDSSDEQDLDEDTNIFECIICNKSFKTERQFEIHENSNKHKKLVKKLKWEMRKEGIELGIDKDDIDLDEFETASENVSEDEEDPEKVSDEDFEDGVSDEKEEENFEVEEESDPRKDGSINEPFDYEVDDVIESEEETYTPNLKSKKSKKKSSAPVDVDLGEVDDELAKLANGMKLESDDDEDWSFSSNKKKLKKKRAPKGFSEPSSRESTPLDVSLPQTNSNTKLKPTGIPNGAELCAVCKEVFTSRNKLFQHMKKTGHAAPPSEVKGKKKGKKNR